MINLSLGPSLEEKLQSAIGNNLLLLMRLRWEIRLMAAATGKMESKMFAGSMESLP